MATFSNWAEGYIEIYKVCVYASERRKNKTFGSVFNLKPRIVWLLQNKRWSAPENKRKEDKRTTNKCCCIKTNFDRNNRRQSHEAVDGTWIKYKQFDLGHR